MEIVSRRQTVVERWSEHAFEQADGYGGWSFDLTADGQIKITEANRENAELCLAGRDRDGRPIYDLGIVSRSNTYVVPAVGRCHCGAEVALEGFTNTCECGADYNSSGQRLAPRSQWGEETGESLGEILAIP